MAADTAPGVSGSSQPGAVTTAILRDCKSGVVDISPDNARITALRYGVVAVQWLVAVV
jgi:hypothetical protein